MVHWQLVKSFAAPRDSGMKRQPLDPKLEFWTARSRAYFTLKLLPRSRAVFRYAVVAFLAQHARQAWRQVSPGHLRALGLQTAGLVLGLTDWLLSGTPRVPPAVDEQS